MDQPRDINALEERVKWLDVTELSKFQVAVELEKLKALRQIAEALDRLSHPSCGHGTVGFCNYCLSRALQEGLQR